MTHQRTSLSLAALKKIISGVDRSIALFDRTGKALGAPEKKVRERLVEVRRQLGEQLEHHSENKE
jgi:hypothetical protein